HVPALLDLLAHGIDLARRHGQVGIVRLGGVSLLVGLLGLVGLRRLIGNLVQKRRDLRRVEGRLLVLRLLLDDRLFRFRLRRLFLLFLFRLLLGLLFRNGLGLRLGRGRRRRG